jgi:hypothetical protein
MTLTDGTGGITMPPGVEFDGMKPFTAELWFRGAPNSSSSGGSLIDHDSWSSTRNGWMLRASTDGVAMERASSVTTVDVLKVPTSVRSWHYLVGVFDGTKQSLFVDGQLEGSMATQTALAALGTTYTIGRQNCSGCSQVQPYIGDIDEVAINDKALSLDQIRAHYVAARN